MRQFYIPVNQHLTESDVFVTTEQLSNMFVSYAQDPAAVTFLASVLN